MEIDLCSHEIVPDDHTVIYDATHNLPVLGITINTVLKAVICMECCEGIEPASIITHAKQHNPHYKPAATIIVDLQARYGLVSLAEVPYSAQQIQPIFGIPIEPQHLHFCAACDRGYRSASTLRGHQSNGTRCNVPIGQRASYMSYGQKLSKGPHKRYFSVDISRLSRRQNIPLSYSRIFQATMPPLPDFTALPIHDIEDQQNLGSFLFREGWLDVIKGLTPSDVQDIVRLPNAEKEPWGKQLQLASHRALAGVQDLIREHHGFGLTQLLAQVNIS